MIEFEWDAAKAKSNERKHGVTFEEATRVFDDPHAVFRANGVVDGEFRWDVLGIAAGVTVLFVVHTIKDSGDERERVRIISARIATRMEQTLYDQNRT